MNADKAHRQATQEQVEGVPGYSQDQGRQEGQEISEGFLMLRVAINVVLLGRHDHGNGVAVGIVYI